MTWKGFLEKQFNVWKECLKSKNRIYLGGKYLENKECIDDMNIFDATNPVQLECLRYCYMHLIQAELDRIAKHCN